MTIAALWQDGKVKRVAVRSAYLVMVGLFLACVARFYSPRFGFAWLIEFGDRLGKTWIAPVHQTSFYLRPDSYGYDGQFYVQLAMEPGLNDPGLPAALDAPAYRARRILFGWTAYILGFGQPAAIMQIYALQNVVAWLLLAVVLLRWFPPTNWENFVRWTGVLFTAGLCNSVRWALIDGPSLLLIAVGVMYFEKKRPWLASVVFAMVTLGRETSALAAASLAEPRFDGWRRWIRLAGQAALVAAPLFCWLIYVRAKLGSAADAGVDNFALPFAEYIAKWREVITGLPWLGGHDSGARINFYCLIAIGVQCLFLLFRPAWRQPWWRVGICYAGLVITLGSAMWAGTPSASYRLIIPMQLAFNVLVPRGPRWWALLLLGNLSVLAAPALLRPPSTFDLKIIDASGGPAGELANKPWNIDLLSGWGGTEGNHSHKWSWARGPAKAVLCNPLEAPVVVTLKANLTVNHPRQVAIVYGGVERWRGELTNGAQLVSTGEIRLAPGMNALEFMTDRPPDPVGAVETRPLAFAISDVALEIRRIEPAPAPSGLKK